MEVKVFNEDWKIFQGDAVVFFTFEEGLEELPHEVLEKVKPFAQDENFKGKKGEILKVPVSGYAFKRIYIAGLGKREKVNRNVAREVSAKVAQRLLKDKNKIVLIDVKKAICSQACSEGLVLGSYNFDKYKTKKDEENSKGWEKVYFTNADEKKVILGRVLAEAQNFTRDLVNTPPNEINPETFPQIAREIAEQYGFEVDIKDPCWVEREMPGLWAVGRGSKTKPRFIHLIYKPQGEAKKKIAFVGKGLTFDSGGLNLKPEQFMKTMKMDKSGACAVLGIFKALGELKKLGLAPQNVEIHGFVGVAENMPGGESYRPDDIIKMRNGKTVEVANTDAEGRITLGDVLTYASEQSPDYIVDMATLTGACVVALGEYTAGIFGNNEDFVHTYWEISKKTGERMWQLPLDDELMREEIKSEVADLSNLGKSRYGGAITAAMFLQEFVGQKDGNPIPWIHIDIAGPAWARKPYKWNPKSGGTGFGVRTAVEFILSEDQNS
ncbi:MAG TPA: leucyl aminopeptidase [Aquificales bacterium]|uniref:Probable cytosol aminopeptidase n=1 Tax=Aquifex aeolicus TaxID=63363 RepID=A0A9D0YPA7_AQUAO|nr:leucyl aminopeptidase [Aquificales bacterium]HIP98451.1 leucyl aminopeptidase [Aquifex aeolicus]